MAAPGLRDDKSMRRNAEQQRNAQLPMTLMRAVNVIDASAVQQSNVPSGIVVRPIVASSSNLQPENPDDLHIVSPGSLSDSMPLPEKEYDSMTAPDTRHAKSNP
jgi:hypothetical protein